MENCSNITETLGKSIRNIFFQLFFEGIFFRTKKRRNIITDLIKASDHECEESTICERIRTLTSTSHPYQKAFEE
jgi:hypothetical protein